MYQKPHFFIHPFMDPKLHPKSLSEVPMDEDEIKVDKKARKLALYLAAKEQSKLKRKENKKNQVKPVVLNVNNDVFAVEKQLAMNQFEVDRSRAGQIDTQILDFVDVLNQIEYCYTTSSCAGRIIVVKTFGDAQMNKKFNIEWVYVTHNISETSTEVDVIWSTLVQIQKEASLQDGEELWFKLEPPIIALRMRDVENTKRLLDTFRTNGFKNSGIRSINQDGSLALTLVDTHKIETLIGVKEAPILISKDYLNILHKAANRKLETSRKRIEKLRILLKDTLLQN